MFFKKKTLEDFSAQRKDSGMLRTLSTVDLTFLGIGGIIGSGVFVLTGIGAARYAGPGIVLSFIAAGLLLYARRSRLRGAGIAHPGGGQRIRLYVCLPR